MTKILVTGCAGFIGSMLSEHLIRDGYEVIGIDCFHANYERSLKERNLNWLLQQPRFRFLEQNLSLTSLDDILTNISYVFHLAALPGVRTSWGNHFTEYVNHNILVTQHLLEAIKETNVKKMIYASSSSVYGGMEGPTDEAQTPLPISPYGVTKLSAEQLCQLYAKNFGIPVISLRYFTVFGPRQRPDMAFHRMIVRVLLEQPVPIYGDGEQSRDFTYIEDIVTANLLVMQSRFSGEIFNIGGISHLTINEVISLIEQYTGKQAIKKYLPVQPGDPKHTWADITKAKNLLGYDPQFDVEKGISIQVENVKRLYRL